MPITDFLKNHMVFVKEEATNCSANSMEDEPLK